jgi:hypothetical protein
MSGRCLRKRAANRAWSGSLRPRRRAINSSNRSSRQAAAAS